MKEKANLSFLSLVILCNNGLNLQSQCTGLLGVVKHSSKGLEPDLSMQKRAF